MAVAMGQKLVPHSAEEIIWAQQKISSGITKMRHIEEHKLAEEMESKFGRKVSSPLFTSKDSFKYIAL